MPIWLRKFTFDRIKEWYEKEAKAKEEPQMEPRKPAKPDIDTTTKLKKTVKTPDYVTKALAKK